MKKFLSIISCSVLFLGVGCSDFGDINKNPNASETPLTSALLTNSLTALGGTTTGGANLITGFYTQYFSQTQYTEASLYQLQNFDWAGEFSGSLKDLQTIIEINSDPETAAVAALNGSNANQIAIARILKAYRYSILTDRYGDIPYFEALKGNAQPAFDSQEAIYKDIFKELDEAVAQFDNSNNVKGDILFEGQNILWKKFANSLRLVLALRVSEVDAALGEAQFQDALADADLVITSNEENVEITYPGTPYRNPWFAIAKDQGVSNVVAEYVNGLGDQRRFAFGNATGGELIGVPYGLTRDDAVDWTGANPDWSVILNNTFRDETSKLFILTYADVLLARAEAARLDWTDEDYEQLYMDAIKASWEQWGVFEQDAYEDYLDVAAVDVTTGDALAKIRFQRWLTFYPNGPQGWAEWRRTGVPALVPSPDALNVTKEIPTRFTYPSVEYSYNRGNLDQAVSRMGDDKDNTKVWWDVN